MILLDLTNAFGSVARSLEHPYFWSTFVFVSCFLKTESFNKGKTIFKDILLYISTIGLRTEGLKEGIITGCVSMRKQDETHLAPIRAYMDDMTVVTKTVPCRKS